MKFLDLGPIARAAGAVRMPGSKSISNRVLLLAALSRGDTLTRLAEQPWDLLVIGGGIVGAGIAAAAAHEGLAVALVERRDFGGATSSASSKLIHGGLRYLRLGDVGLVDRDHQGLR